MRIVIQRCYDASVSVNGQIVGKINKGIMILVGFTKGDNEQILNKMAYKTANMRIFEDENSKMNKNLKAINGDVLSISQFTLYANNKNGNRPSFTEALDFDNAYNLYNKFNEILEKEYGLKVEKGTFGADMKVTFTNDGPVTIILDYQLKYFLYPAA